MKTLSSLPASVQSVSISDDSPAAVFWNPKGQKAVYAEVSAWLKSVVPYTEKLPQSEDVGAFHANIGPSILHIVVSDQQQILVYPAWYTKKDGENEPYNARSVVHYLQDVIAVNNGGTISYYQSQPLYDWLKTGRWQDEFTRG